MTFLDQPLVLRDRFRIDSERTLKRFAIRGGGLVGLAVLATGGIGAAGLLAVVLGTAILTWRRTVIGFIGVCMLIPIHMYALPGNLPFEAKLDRVVLMPVLVFWLAAVLSGARRPRATPMGLPLAMFGTLMLVSLIVNQQELNVAGALGDTFKKDLYFLGFFVAYFVIGSVLEPHDVPRVVRWIGIFGLLVGLGTYWEYFTGYNVFRHADQFLPFLKQTSSSLGVTYTRQGNGPARMVGSSEHPISFAVVMLLLLPIYQHLVRDAGSRRMKIVWLIGALMILGAALLSGTRTSIVGLLLVGLVAGALRPKQIPGLIVVGLVGFAMTWVAAPATIGSVRAAMFPSNAEAQKTNVQGRTEDYGRVFGEWSKSPFVGQGYGSFSPQRYFFVDNAWLKLLPDLGSVGLFCLLFVFWRATQMGWRTAKSRAPGAGAAGALTTSILVYMFTALLYDALDFTQPTYLMFIFAALAGVLDRERHELAIAGRIPGRRWEVGLRPATA